MMRTLFVREHNAICDFLGSLHPEWSDQELFDYARLINAALIAKIHTVEWTPALLADAGTSPSSTRMLDICEVISPTTNAPEAP